MDRRYGQLPVKVAYLPVRIGSTERELPAGQFGFLRIRGSLCVGERLGGCVRPAPALVVSDRAPRVQDHHENYYPATNGGLRHFTTVAERHRRSVHLRTQF